MAATVLSDEVTLFFVSHALCDIVISAVEDCSLTTGSSTKVVCCFQAYQYMFPSVFSASSNTGL